MILHRAFIGRTLVLALMVLALIVMTVGVAGASSEGAELRRIDTSNVNKSTDIKAVVDPGDKDADHEAAATGDADEHADDSDGREATDDGHAENVVDEGHEDEGDEHAAAATGEGESGGEEAVHHPAWMFTGWQSVFTVLAVIYFGLGVTLLPLIMAKEEH